MYSIRQLEHHLNTKDYVAIREVNLDAAGKYREELKVLYDRIKE